MKKLTSLVASLAMLVLTAACDDPTAAQAPAGASPVAATAPKPQVAPMPAAASFKVWPPPLTEKQLGELKLASDLLAKNYIFVLDRSSSMWSSACETGGSSKITIAEKAMLDFEPLIPQDANIGLVEFIGSRIYLVLPLGTGAEHRKAFRARVATGKTSGGTPLGPAVLAGYAELTRQAQRQLGYGTYDLVVVTDGEADSISELNDAVSRVRRESPTRIQTIGFCISDKHSLNQPGRTVFKQAGRYETLKQGLEEVFAEAATFSTPAFRK